MIVLNGTGMCLVTKRESFWGKKGTAAQASIPKYYRIDKGPKISGDTNSPSAAAAFLQDDSPLAHASQVLAKT